MPEKPSPLPPATGEPAIRRLYFGRHRHAFRFGTYLGLLRTMGIGHLVTALYGHTQLVSATFPRLARTRQTLRDLVWHGLDTPAGQVAMQRVVDSHRHVSAAPDDYRYVLSVFVLEPVRWNRQFGRTPLSLEELDLLVRFWGEVGQAMGIAGLPHAIPAWEAFQQDYERTRLVATEPGHRLAALCLNDVVRLSLPRGTQTMSRHLLLGTMEPRVREVLGLPQAPRLWRWLVPVLLRVLPG